MNWEQALSGVGAQIVYPAEPDVTAAVIERITAPPMPWWYRPRLATAAVALAVIAVVVGLVPAAREEVASWLGIGGVTVETLPPPTAAPVTAPGTTTPTPPASLPAGVVQSGLGEGLQLGREIVSLTVEGEVGFRPLYPAPAVDGLALGLPDREFVDGGDRAWLLYGSGRGLPEMQIPNMGMIVTQFRAESPGITKQVAAGEFEFVDFGDGLFGLWLPGPHELILPEADGSAVDGRSAGNTLLWEQDGLTIRLESDLSLAEAVAIAETFS